MATSQTTQTSTTCGSNEQDEQDTMLHDCKNLKVVLLGPAQIGKTRFVKCAQMAAMVRAHGFTLVFDAKVDAGRHKYLTTIGVEVHPVRVDTAQGEICYNIWDVSGNPKFHGLDTAYWIRADAFIVMDHAPEENPKLEIVKRDYPNAKIAFVDPNHYDPLAVLASLA